MSETWRCECFHVMTRHGSKGCRYCDCPKQYPTIKESVERVAATLEAQGDPESAAQVRAMLPRSTP